MPCWPRWLDFAADDWQAKVLRSSGQNILLNCSRQAGKSTTTAVIALHTAFYPPEFLRRHFRDRSPDATAALD